MRELRVLCLPKYGRLGASSRLRMYQYLPALAAAGIHCTVAPMFPDSYIRGIQARGRSPKATEAGAVSQAGAVRPSRGKSLRAAGGALLSRARKLVQGGEFDLVWIEKDPLPWVPDLIERVLIPSRVPYVLDYDDAVFHFYDASPKAWVRRLLGTKHQALMRRSAAVCAGNAYLADYAKAAGQSNTALLPTAVDLARYDAEASAQAEKVMQGAREGTKPPVIGWIGQTDTAYLLNDLANVFNPMSAMGEATFSTIGVSGDRLNFPVTAQAWTEETEVARLKTFDIGVMPLRDGILERGKCGYKLIQYMACGLPVVASPVGVNQEIVAHGVTGFLAATEAEWREALNTLVGDAALRARMGAAGRAAVAARYCTEQTTPQLVQVLQHAAQAA